MSNAREIAQLGSVPSGRRNLIVNGAMQVAQRGTSHTLTSSNYGSLDRWSGSGFGGPTCTMEQSTTTPANFKNSLKFTVTTGATVDATDYSDVRHHIEGNNISHLNWGTADAQDVAISFWVRCSSTGTFAVSFVNSAYNRCYPATYTINSADTWEYKTITIPGDTSGTWLDDSGVGLRVIFDLGIGSTYSSTTGEWSAGTYFGGTGVTKLSQTTGATWYVTGVQLEVGSVATEFEHRSYGEELALCQRYYYRTGRDISGVSNSVHTGTFWGAGSFYGTIFFPVQLRAQPIFSSGSSVGGYIVYSAGTTSLPQSAQGVEAYGLNSINIYYTNNISGTIGNAGWVEINSDSAYLEFDAEL